LAIAAYAGQSEAVALLLERGSDANSLDGLGHSALSEAVMSKHIRCCELLLPRTDLSIMNKQGLNVFHNSVTTASYDCFKLLLPRMADVDVRTVAGMDAAGNPETPGQTAAHLACDKGQHKMLEKLLRRGASRTARDSRQAMPLHYAASTGQLSCIVLLIGHPEAYKLAPADINAADLDGCTPLHCAACHNQAECCGLLIAAGARLDARSSSEKTSLMVAQHFHPSNTALHDLLAGRGPERPPGTTCDRCGCPEDPASHLMPCSGCQVARYCSVACQHAAWEAHEAECGRLKAEREARSCVLVVV
jgi:ankyrin repeat protein